jgi:hypothetical protein
MGEVRTNQARRRTASRAPLARRSPSVAHRREHDRAPERRARRALFGLCACGVLAARVPAADAFELSGGVSLGGILAGARPRLAVTPHVGISWRMESGLLFAAHEMLSILPATDPNGPGVHSRTSAVLGYATENAAFTIGPSFSIYSMVACNTALLCGRVVGVSPGGHAQVNVYFAGPLGVSISAGVDWIGGISLVIPGSVAATILAGPVFRWSRR